MLNNLQRLICHKTQPSNFFLLNFIALFSLYHFVPHSYNLSSLFMVLYHLLLSCPLGPELQMNSSSRNYAHRLPLLATPVSIVLNKLGSGSVFKCLKCSKKKNVDTTGHFWNYPLVCLWVSTFNFTWCQIYPCGEVKKSQLAFYCNFVWFDLCNSLSLTMDSPVSLSFSVAISHSVWHLYHSCLSLSLQDNLDMITFPLSLNCIFSMVLSHYGVSCLSLSLSLTV